MYPRHLLDEEVRTSSERKVFDALQKGLDDAWEAYHSSSWILDYGGQGAVDGEIDFVLCHPNKGLLCLEVKGGGIESRYGEWWRVGPEGAQRIKDPFTQALDHRYALKRMLARADSRLAEKALIGHAVVFPYVTIHQLALAPDAPREVLIDRHDVSEIDEAVERVLDYQRGSSGARRGPGANGAQTVRDTLAPRVRLRVPMAAEFSDEEEALVLLTHEQTIALARMRRDPRMVITGCAGSGKTMLAVAHAKRLAREGKSVLFACFNRGLRDHLRETERADNVTYQTFHGLCLRLAKAAGIELADHPVGAAPPEFWRTELPDALIAALASIDQRFDAVVVDEAQDFHGDWVAALMCALRHEESDPVWLFRDDNQRVYDAQLEVPPEFRPYDLTVNCRNTQAIHREVMKLYEGAVEPEVMGPPGREMEILHSADAPAAVSGLLERLCGAEEIPPQDVTVLSSQGFDRSEVARAAGGRYRLVKERGRLGRAVHFSSIRGFKGLESPVVILCELEGLNDMTQDQQLYVGLSRAKNHCVVVAPTEARAARSAHMQSPRLDDG